MAIITKAGSPVKGSATQFTLHKSALASVPSVAAHSYFSDMANWSSVVLEYVSSSGSQTEILKFDATLSSPTADFKVSLKARDVFQIHSIIIKDFDHDSFTVHRSELTVSEFDVDMTSAPSAVPLLTTASGYTDYYNFTSQKSTYMFVGSPTFPYQSTQSTIYYNPNPAGMTNGTTYKIRFYLSQLSCTDGTNFELFLSGYDTPVSISGANCISSFNANGYVEFQYAIAAGYAWGMSARSIVQSSCSFTVSKVEIYSV